ncbi:hypothetical protein GCM10011413_23270 [Pedobacter psychrotolerans]|uniref:Uncharacterized protein n=1 Tax=Pedobacter psychrotolerans TaxID=1843235 RepID=A0ABQ1SQA8_9SPHI|nr:hypothetical protein GCM10011413_23270 [Pedobacter psychrotolerans]
MALPPTTKTPPSIGINPGPGARLYCVATAKAPEALFLLLRFAYGMPVLLELFPPFELQPESKTTNDKHVKEYSNSFFISYFKKVSTPAVSIDKIKHFK